MEIREPISESEWQQYYELRWRVLREQWGQPRGSEKDGLEDAGYHLMAIEDGRGIGVGRAHFNHSGEGQIRYMAVDPLWRGRGVGRSVIERLEIYLLRNAVGAAVLTARKDAVGFYEKLGYYSVSEGPVLFGCIEHVNMRKQLMRS